MASFQKGLNVDLGQGLVLTRLAVRLADEPIRTANAVLVGWVSFVLNGVLSLRGWRIVKIKGRSYLVSPADKVGDVYRDLVVLPFRVRQRILEEARRVYRESTRAASEVHAASAEAAPAAEPDPQTA